MPGKRQPIAIIGLDAATWDVVDPWIEDGLLPNLQTLIRRGSSGRLRSTLHPISPVAWASAVTGKAPGKHGVFDWRVRDPRTYHADTVTAQSIQSPTIWQLVNAMGRSAGVVNVPLTYPPMPLQGYMISGILTPNNAKVFTHPQALLSELNQVADGYPVFFGETYRQGEEPRYLGAIHRTMEKRRRAILHLLQTRPTDLTMVVFMESDHVQHDFWKYMDLGSPGYHPEFVRYQHAIRDVFVALDHIIGEMLSLLPSDTTVFVVSDHGAGPLRKVVYIEKVLIQKGLMRLKSSPVTHLKRWALKSDLPTEIYQMFSHLGIDVRQWVPKKYRTRLINAGMSSTDIDWSHTKAYSCGDFGQIAINLQGRERFGSVAPADYETVRGEVIAALRELRDPETGEHIVDHVYRREDIYDGPYLESAPDVLFSMQDYSYVTSRSLGLNSDALMEPHRFGQSGNSGSHAIDGLLIAHGPHIRTGETIHQARLIDLAPTALYAMGLPIPSDMDGQVLTQLFDREYVSGHPVQYQRWDTEWGAGAQPPLDTGLSEQESAEIRKRLEDLGYLG